MLTQERLKELLHYDPNTGHFRWKVSNAYTVIVGQIAGWNNGKSARRINIDMKPYLAHRLAWFYVYGEWPNQIDHINRNRMDNRICNLRNATNSQNQANMKAKSNNRLGIRGLSFKDGQYHMQLRKDGVVYRAKFKSFEYAKVFTAFMSKELHGEFSVHS